MIRRPCVWGRTGTKRRRSQVSPSEGNEARREGSQEVAASHSSGEAGERPFRTPWSEGDAALWRGSWNHAEDTVPHQRVTAKRPSRVRDSDIPHRDEPDALMCTSGSVEAPGITPWGDPAPILTTYTLVPPRQIAVGIRCGRTTHARCFTSHFSPDDGDSFIVGTVPSSSSSEPSSGS
jgi:hypothetical protein